MICRVPSSTRAASTALTRFDSWCDSWPTTACLARVLDTAENCRDAVAVARVGALVSGGAPEHERTAARCVVEEALDVQVRPKEASNVFTPDPSDNVWP